MLPEHQAPHLSVILVTPDRYETLRKTVSHIRKQTCRDRMELVFVAPSAEELGLETSELAVFLGWQVVETGPVHSVAAARAAGVQAARAPLVVFTEDHCYPAAGWAEALLAAHQGPWAAVGPAVGNANPGSMASWATFFVQHGRWIAQQPPGPIDDLPGHNSCYKRELLLKYGDRLEAMLEAETILHEDLKVRGGELYLETSAKVYHLNMTRPLSFVSEHYNYGRMFAAARARAWPFPKRLLYVGGSPLIPLVRLRRLLPAIRRAPEPMPRWPGLMGPLLAALACSAAGEVMGYAFGPGDSVRRMADLEFHRERHLA